MRNQVLQAIHLGLQGENKCILWAWESVFWLGISTDIRQMVKNSDLCNKYQPAQPKLTIMQPDLPTRPWEKLGTNIFEQNGKKYLMVVDYCSRLPVIRLPTDMTGHTVCNHFTSILAEYSLPATIIADFGSRRISERFRSKFVQSGITLHCSSPYHQQANSLAERAIATCKSVLRKALEEKECPYTALWIYRTTPLDDQTHHPASYFLDVNLKQHSQAAGAPWSPDTQIMTSTKKLTRGSKKSRQYFMTEELVVTKGPLTTRNRCSSGMPWRGPGNQQLG